MNVDITELVFSGRDNAPVLKFNQDGAALDSTGIQRTLVEDVAGAFTIDTANAQNALTWSGNELTLSLGDQSIAPGTYLLRITVFDVLNPDGLVIQHEDSKPRVKLRVKA